MYGTRELFELIVIIGSSSCLSTILLIDSYMFTIAGMKVGERSKGKAGRLISEGDA